MGALINNKYTHMEFIIISLILAWCLIIALILKVSNLEESLNASVYNGIVAREGQDKAIEKLQDQIGRKDIAPEYSIFRESYHPINEKIESNRSELQRMLEKMRSLELYLGVNYRKVKKEFSEYYLIEKDRDTVDDMACDKTVSAEQVDIVKKGFRQVGQKGMASRRKR